jgi:hypothetical protein
MDVVVQHVLEHREDLGAAVAVVVVPLVGVGVGMDVGLAVLVGVGVLVYVLPVGVGMLVIKMSHDVGPPYHIDIILTKYTILQIVSICKE